MAWTNPYSADVAFTQTALDALATSSSLLGGWTGESVTTAADDYLLSGTFQLESAGVAAGRIHVYVYTVREDTPTWPDIFSAGTEGTAGTATVHNAQIRDSAMRLVWATDTAVTVSLFYSMPQIALAQFFGNVMPTHWAPFVTQSSGAALESTGDPNQLHYKPVTFAGP